MRLGYSQGSHYWVNFYHYIAGLLGSGHSVVQSTQCDMFFYSFWNMKDAQKCKRDTKLVFVSGECWDTSKARCSLLIDCKSVFRSGPFLYYPFYALSFFERSSNMTGCTQLVKSPQYNAQTILLQKTKFCAFMYRYDVDFRVQLYDDINRYKSVDALGKSRNRNPNVKTDRGQSSYMNNAVDKYRPYKFVICCENTRHPGYITEKIINGMLANAIPIYYGASDVTQHFNPKSFIDIGAFPSREAAIEYIKRVDQDDTLYCSILNEPWFHNNTPSKYFDPNYVRQAFQNLPSVGSSAPSRSPAPYRRMKPMQHNNNMKPMQHNNNNSVRKTRLPARRPLMPSIRKTSPIRSRSSVGVLQVHSRSNSGHFSPRRRPIFRRTTSRILRRYVKR